MSKRLFAILALVSLAGLGVWAKRPNALLALGLQQPEYLSVQVANPITVMVTSPADCSEELTLSVRSEDGLISQPVWREQVRLQAGVNAVRASIAPAKLSAFSIGEDVLLTAQIRQASAETEVTLAAKAKAPRASKWSIAFASKPALLYTTSDATLSFVVANHKSKTKQAKVVLKFITMRGRVKAKMKVATVFQPGTNPLDIQVPTATALLAKSQGATKLRAVLQVRGQSRANDIAYLDYDLGASAVGSPLSGVAPLSVSFTGAVSGGYPPYSYDWKFGDSTPHSSDLSPSHTYSTPGSFAAQLTVTDVLGGVVEAAPLTVAVAPPLSLACGASPSGGAAPLPVTFSAAATGGSGSYAYTWSFGDGASSSQQNPSHTYTAAGSYGASVTVTSGAQSASCSKTITVSAPALAVTCSATPTSGAAPLAVSFACQPSGGGSGSYVFDWNFGDGSADDTSQNPSHTYSANGTFTAVVTVTAGSQSASCQKTITVGGSTPVAVTCSAAPSSGPAPLAVSFTCQPSGGTGSYTYDWDFGDGSPHLTAQNPSHTYSAGGAYTASVAVVSGSQSGSCQTSITVSGSPLTIDGLATADLGNGTYSIDWLLNDTDSAAATITWNAAVTAGGGSVNPTSGTSNPGDAPNTIYSPNGATTGTITITASDDQGNTAAPQAVTVP
ncbi:MAG: PKD domain-containing protein [Acidobacteriota bacterium]